MLARQRIVGLEPVTGEDGISRCAIVLDAEVTRTQAVPRRPFQGWRYLEEANAPPDLAAGEINDSDPMPPRMLSKLIGMGLV